MSDRHLLVAEGLRRLRRALAIRVQTRLREGDSPFPVSDMQADLEYVIEQLASAVAVNTPALFGDYVSWSGSTLAYADAGPARFRLLLDALRFETREALPPVDAEVLEPFWESTKSAQDGQPEDAVPTGPHAKLSQEYLLAVLEGRTDEAQAMVLEAVDQGAEPRQILDDVVFASQRRLGTMWQRGELATSEEHVASRLAERLVTLIDSRTPKQPKNGRRIVLASVGGNDHDLGIRLVAHEFETQGWTSILLGANSPAADAARAIIDYEADAIGLSATMPHHVAAAADAVRMIRSLPERADTPIIVGGPPFELDPELWKRIGADGKGSSPEEAVSLADSLVASR